MSRTSLPVKPSLKHKPQAVIDRSERATSENPRWAIPANAIGRDTRSLLQRLFRDGAALGKGKDRRVGDFGKSSAWTFVAAALLVEPRTFDQKQQRVAKQLGVCDTCLAAKLQYMIAL